MLLKYRWQKDQKPIWQDSDIFDWFLHMLRTPKPFTMAV